MKTLILFFATSMAVSSLLYSQGTAINTSGAAADNSAMLDVSSTSKGMLVPRMTKAEKLAIASPANGLLVYQTNDTTGFWYYNGTKWMQALGGSGSGSATGCFVQIVKTQTSPISVDNTTFLNDNELFLI